MHWTYWIAEDYLQIYSDVAWDFEGIALPRVGGGERYSTNVYTGRLRPDAQPLPLLDTIFHEQGTPFVGIPSID